MKMREYRADDLETVMAIADLAWRPIRQMGRETLGDAIADILNPMGDAKSKGLQVKAQIESGKYGIAICEHENTVVGFRYVPLESKKDVQVFVKSIKF